MSLGVVAAEPSQWQFGWEALVAIGTLALALATGALARSTRNLARKTADEVKHSGELVRVSQQQVKLAQDQTQAAFLTLDAQMRPVLIDVPTEALGRNEEEVAYPGRAEAVRVRSSSVHVMATGEEILVSVPVRNAGTGLARIGRAEIVWSEPTAHQPSKFHQPSTFPEPSTLSQPDVVFSPANVAPGEQGRVSFRIPAGWDAFDRLSKLILMPRRFSVEVRYWDLVGRQGTVSTFRLERVSTRLGGWRIKEVKIREEFRDQAMAARDQAENRHTQN